MTREELNAVRGYVSNMQAIKDAHNKEQLPINYGTICDITANGWKLIEEFKALEQQSNTWSLDDAREDFMCDVYNVLDFLPTNNEANRIIDSFDRVTSGLKRESCEDCISRADAKKYLSAPDANGDRVIYESDLDLLPPVQPKYNTSEWCHDCKEYDQEKHCCPRFNRVIRNAVEEIKQPKTHWISYWDEEARCYVYKCPECGNKQPFDTKHCWECGTKLSEIPTGLESGDKE